MDALQDSTCTAQLGIFGRARIFSQSHVLFDVRHCISTFKQAETCRTALKEMANSAVALDALLQGLTAPSIAYPAFTAHTTPIASGRSTCRCGSNSPNLAFPAFCRRGGVGRHAVGTGHRHNLRCSRKVCPVQPAPGSWPWALAAAVGSS